MSADRRLQLIERVLHLPDASLDAVERCLASLHPIPETQQSDHSQTAAMVKWDWPHAPVHRISEAGTYMVTASTLDKAHLFRGAERLDYLQAELLSHAMRGGWQLEAWAIFSNHYHFIGHASRESMLLSRLLGELHRTTAHHINTWDHTSGRQVWFQYWDKQLTYESSYLARLNYVHLNPVKHGLVPVANQYRWCSAGWFERTAAPAQVQTIYRQKTDRIQIDDEYGPV